MAQLDDGELDCHGDNGGHSGSGGVFLCACSVASNLDLT